MGVGGFVVLLIAAGAPPPWGGLLFMAALLATTLGLGAAAGYQLIARVTRPASAFRGPSPAILLALQLIVSIALGTAWVVLGVPDPQSSSAGFLIIAATLLVTYVGIVWLFVVRSGVLSWSEMGWPTRAPASRLLGDVGVGFAAMLVAWPVVTFLAALLGTLLQSTPTNPVPSISTTTDTLLTAIGAALLVPIGEEVLFRGYALTAWLRDLGPRSALIRSTLFFAFAHILGVTAASFDEGWRQALLTVVVITPVGAVLGILFLRRGLLAAIAGHVTFNLISVLAMALAQSLLPPQ
ncbi:MAG TPA: type II CAAX endopeptidase family protein [Candidatus Limnocylindrales bacterium]|nr:type II CAAX endopeptidase family protein [Candidatus Limnocylindrales bacterium]